jgi:hypothetical protein
MRCAYPRCFHLATVRCTSCGHRYCVGHCSDLVVHRPEDTFNECDLCKQHLTPEQVQTATQPGPLVEVGAIILFLLVVAGGTAVDISTRGSGFFVLGVFAVAFVTFVTCMHR